MPPETGREWTPESLVNPEELGEYFEGDIELPLPPLDKNGLLDEKYRWPGGVVPFEFDSDFGGSSWFLNPEDIYKFLRFLFSLVGSRPPSARVGYIFLYKTVPLVNPKYPPLCQYIKAFGTLVIFF